MTDLSTTSCKGTMNHQTTFVDLHQHAVKNIGFEYASLPNPAGLHFEAITNQQTLVLFPTKTNVVKARLILGCEKTSSWLGTRNVAYAYICKKSGIGKAMLRLGNRHLRISSLDQIDFVKPFDAAYDAYGMTDRAIDRFCTLAAYYFLASGHVHILRTHFNFNEVFAHVCSRIYMPITRHNHSLKDHSRPRSWGDIGQLAQGEDASMNGRSQLFDPTLDEDHDAVRSSAAVDEQEDSNSVTAYEEAADYRRLEDSTRATHGSMTQNRMLNGGPSPNSLNESSHNHPYPEESRSKVWNQARAVETRQLTIGPHTIIEKSRVRSATATDGADTSHGSGGLVHDIKNAHVGPSDQPVNNVLDSSGVRTLSDLLDVPNSVDLKEPRSKTPDVEDLAQFIRAYRKLQADNVTLEAARDENINLRVLLDEARKKEEAIIASLDKYKQSESTKAKDIANLHAQLNGSLKQHRELKIEAAELKQVNDRIQEDLQRAQAAKKDAENTAGAERANRLQRMMEYGDLIGENQSLKREVDVLQKENLILKAQGNALEQETENMKNKFAEYKRKIREASAGL